MLNVSNNWKFRFSRFLKAFSQERENNYLNLGSYFSVPADAQQTEISGFGDVLVVLPVSYVRSSWNLK